MRYLDKVSWAVKAELEGNKNWNKIAYMEGAEEFQKRVLEEIDEALKEHLNSMERTFNWPELIKRIKNLKAT